MTGSSYSSNPPMVTFPIMIKVSGLVAIRYQPAGTWIDPRRIPADNLPRTRRCPPPVEDDTAENIFLLVWVIVFVLAVW